MDNIKKITLLDVVRVVLGLQSARRELGLPEKHVEAISLSFVKKVLKEWRKKT